MRRLALGLAVACTLVSCSNNRSGGGAPEGSTPATPSTDVPTSTPTAAARPASQPAASPDQPEATPESVREEARPPNPHREKIIVDAASAGPRDLGKAQSAMRTFVSTQPYGKTWKDLVRTEQSPSRSEDLGKADTHPALKFDPIEMQEQVQFLQETGIEARYGFVSIRGIRVFAYGKLSAVQIVLERIGNTDEPEFHADLKNVASAWSDAEKTFGQGKFRSTRNDLLAVHKAKSRAEYPKPPFRIELEPVGEAQ